MLVLRENAEARYTPEHLEVLEQSGSFITGESIDPKWLETEREAVAQGRPSRRNERGRILEIHDVGVEQDVYCGDVSVTLIDEDVAEVGIVVMPAHRRKRVASRTVELAVGRLENEGLSEVRAIVYRANPVCPQLRKILGDAGFELCSGPRDYVEYSLTLPRAVS